MDLLCGFAIIGVLFRLTRYVGNKSICFFQKTREVEQMPRLKLTSFFVELSIEKPLKVFKINKAACTV